MIRERARLGLECNFFDLSPRQHALHLGNKVLELIDGKVGRRAAAEVNKTRLAPADKGFRTVDPQLADHSIHVAADRRGIFVRINFEVTKMTALAAKRNV